MAIDYGVYQLQKPVPAIDAEQIATGVLNQQTLIAKGQQQQQQMADDAQTRQILQQYGGDKQHVIDALRAKGLYAPADAIEKADVANRKARADALETALKNQSSVNTQLSGYVAAAKDGLTPENAPQRMAILRSQILSTPADPDDPPGTREQLASQLAQFDPVNTPKVLDQWANGLLDEQQQITNHQNTLKMLYGTDPVRGAAEMLAATKDRDDAVQEYQTILSTVHDPDGKTLIAKSFGDPAALTTPEAFEAWKQHASDLATTTKEKADIENSKAIRAQAAATFAQTQQRDLFNQNVALQRLQQGAQRLAQAASGANATNDVAEAVSGMKDGTIPPQLPGRASKEYVQLLAEAHRQGVDLVKLNEDWNATTKYLSTLNGDTQVRYRQAVNQVQESVPLVRALVTQWDSKGLPVLSSATLDSAAKGALGKDAQSLAVRLKGQVADMVSELGTVYKGGNSSTDESLKLAAQNLQADWSKKAALDALDQIDQNIDIKNHSIRNAGALANEGNIYAPTVPAAPSAAAAQGVSSAVKSLLSSQKPGQYELSDGHTYKKAADGTISVIK